MMKIKYFVALWGILLLSMSSGNAQNIFMTVDEQVEMQRNVNLDGKASAVFVSSMFGGGAKASAANSSSPSPEPNTEMQSRVQYSNRNGGATYNYPQQKEKSVFLLLLCGVRPYIPL